MDQSLATSTTLALATGEVSRGAQPVADAVPSDPVAHFLLLLAVIVVVSNLLGSLARSLRQPPVVGQIVGGLLLGPSALGYIWPAASAWLSAPPVVDTLSAVAQLGLVTFMFLLGCELRLRQSGVRARSVCAVTAGSMGLPFLGGVAVALVGAPVLAGSASQSTAYLLAFGLAVSITALPVLARILVDTGLDQSRAGTISLAAAAVGDGAVWLVLTVILEASTLAEPSQILLRIGIDAAVVLATFVIVRPLLALLARLAAEATVLVPALMAGALGYAALVQFIGLHAAIGAFLFGAILPRELAVVRTIRRQLHGFADTILLPVFFTSVGLGTTIAAFTGSPFSWLVLATVVLVALATKICGAGAGAYLTGIDVRNSLRIGALMNCRGVTELVVATILLQHHLVSDAGFTILVLMAVLTTIVTGPLIRILANEHSVEVKEFSLSGRLP